MLLAALRQTSSSVTVDVLANADLDAMRADVHHPRAAPAFTAAAGDRRYLVLTHTSDFDRAHYPLPLSHSDSKKRAAAEQVRDWLPPPATARRCCESFCRWGTCTLKDPCLLNYDLTCCCWII